MTADCVLYTRKGQKTPKGFYNIERMVKALAQRGEVATRGSCCAARGLEPEDKIQSVLAGSLDLHGDWVLEAAQVIVY